MSFLLAAALCVQMSCSSGFTDGELPYRVHHSPYLQLGDAPLVGFAGSETDQVEILWQTAGVPDSHCRFTVAYRPAGAASWTSAGDPQSIDTGVDSRVVHFVRLAGLDYAADYEYRVQHLRDDRLLNTWQSTFRTRLASSDDTPFSFVAYGDSATRAALTPFRNVHSRINRIDTDLVILLGDNAYEDGSHADLDARFDPRLSPEATKWNAGHIDYFAIGNHDVRTAAGRPSRDSFSVPIPVAGVSAPASPPPGEHPEHNYSFDYGCAHFATFDSNPRRDEARLNALLTWLEADLNATKAMWKIVFAHHPIAGGPDKGESPADHYYQQLVKRLRAAGADLFMVGHSHTQSRTYPLLGAEGGRATFIKDIDSDYAKRAGLVQIIAGAAGRSLRPGDLTQFPFVARGFTSETSPPLKYGFTHVHVTPSRLTISYIAADDGAVMDRFTITAPR